jgi:16S rRNA (guanine527-N7)-methyltransferase
MTPQAALERGLHGLQIELSAAAREQLLAYVALLGKWNRTYNLTAIRDPLAMVGRHLLDSLSVLPHLPMPPAGRLADVGSGAGLPGIPLAIARPSWRVVLAEASAKKTAFLRQAAIELALRNVEVHAGRVEDWRPPQLFSVVISRAFAALTAFAAACAHLLAEEGVLAAMKGALPRDELQRLTGWNCAVIGLRVPLMDAERHLLLCRQRGR